ncbi:VanZ family protein [Lewinella sp. JB7]|uniref:VanZ family protein n=1 Tax=Lewinella sp. JB7 TaxID=2962887 RepID=UPI0020C9DCEC|nr:VanZ family protein [Lewinella sp. JB7]MCP9234783.1 VanZ family protein [Lewinella sp. JB7]
MPTFTTRREKHLWYGVAAVVITIAATLFVGQPLADLFADQNVRAAIFLLVMGLIAATVLIYTLKKRPGRVEGAAWVGMGAVYVMFFLRLGMPERSHLMEFTVLAVLLHAALDERMSGGRGHPRAALYALLISVLLGVVDECAQLLVPDRVFDPADMVFNGLAAALAIGTVVGVGWVRRAFGSAH